MICALCVREFEGEPRILDGKFKICPICDAEHPRQGRYSFGGGTEVSGIGEGNNRLGMQGGPAKLRGGR